MRYNRQLIREFIELSEQPIVTNKYGYYTAECQDDIDRYQNYLQSHIEGTTERSQLSRRLWNNSIKQTQLC